MKPLGLPAQKDHYEHENTSDFRSIEMTVFFCQEKEGMFSGILKRKTKAPADGTPAQVSLSSSGDHRVCLLQLLIVSV